MASPMRDRDRLSIWQKTAYSLPQVGINLMGVMVAQWLTFFYIPPVDDLRAPLVGAGVFATVMLIGRVVDGVADPLIGHWSDTTRSRWGRRMPFVLVGTPLLAFTFAAMWFPPDAEPTRGNAAYLGTMLIVYWVAFTVVVGPYYALLPEIARTTTERVRLSAVMAVYTALGSVVASVAVGHWQSARPSGITWLGFDVGGGIQASALIAAVLTALAFVVMPLGIKETPHDASKEVPPSLVEALKAAFSNSAFRAYLGLSVLVQLGTLTFGTGLPYLCTTVLERPGVFFELGPFHVIGSEPGLVGPGEGEAWTGTLMGVLYGVAILSLPLVNVVAERVGKNRLMVGAGIFFSVALALVPATTLFDDPAVPVMVMVGLLGFPVSCALVLVNAIGADVVDYDEARSGMRREGIYSGASALVAKTAQGLGPAIVVGLMTFGASRANPLGILLVGPASAVLVALGTFIFSRTPVRDDRPPGAAVEGDAG